MKKTIFFLFFILILPIVMADSIANTSSNISVNISQEPIATTSSGIQVIVEGPTPPSNPPSSGGGSSSGGGVCTPEWNCTGWNECSDGEQTRTCIDRWDCDDDSSKPSEIQICFVPEESESKNETTIEKIKEEIKETAQEVKEWVIENWQLATFLAGVIICITIYFYLAHRRKKNGHPKINEGIPQDNHDGGPGSGPDSSS